MMKSSGLTAAGDEDFLSSGRLCNANKSQFGLRMLVSFCVLVLLKRDGSTVTELEVTAILKNSKLGQLWT